jgi:hypothetical protein
MSLLHTPWPTAATGLQGKRGSNVERLFIFSFVRASSVLCLLERMYADVCLVSARVPNCQANQPVWRVIDGLDSMRSLHGEGESG